MGTYRMGKYDTGDVMVEKVKDLYILTRSKWIKQVDNGSYMHMKYSLHDGQIEKHMKQEITLGVFSGSEFTKWLCWDVDYSGDTEKAKRVTTDIVNHLEDECHIDRDSILVSFSGSKGYHVEIFFDEAIYLSHARKFHSHVVAEVGETTDKVEFRPNNNQGVKLPFSINKKTGSKCTLVDAHFRAVEDEELLNIQKVDAQRFLDNISDMLTVVTKTNVKLNEDEIVQFEDVLDAVTIDIPVDVEERCTSMLQEGSLIYPDSRHESSYFLAIFLKEQGNDEEDAIDYVSELIKNTYKTKRSYIDPSTTEEFALKEVARLVRYVYKKDKVFFSKIERVIKVHENEIKEVITPKQIHLKMLLFILMIHSKKYAGKDDVFFMTYKQMNEMGASAERSRVLKQLKTLEEAGYIEIVERNRKNGLKHLPNRYKVKFSPQSENYIELNSLQEELVLEQVVCRLLTEVEVKSVVAKKQFYTNFKPEFKALIS